MRFKAPGNRTPLQISDSSLMPTIKNFVTHYGRSEKKFFHFLHSDINLTIIEESIFSIELEIWAFLKIS